MRVDRVSWKGRLVTSPGTAGLPPFMNAVGLLAGIQGSPDWSPEAQSITARLLQDPVHGSRLFLYLPIEIRRIVTTSLTEPAQMLHTLPATFPCLRNHHPADLGRAAPSRPPVYILAVYVNDQRRLVAMPLPDLDDGDPCAHLSLIHI